MSFWTRDLKEREIERIPHILCKAIFHLTRYLNSICIDTNNSLLMERRLSPDHFINNRMCEDFCWKFCGFFVWKIIMIKTQQVVSLPSFTVFLIIHLIVNIENYNLIVSILRISIPSIYSFKHRHCIISHWIYI